MLAEQPTRLEWHEVRGGGVSLQPFEIGDGPIAGDVAGVERPLGFEENDVDLVGEGHRTVFRHRGAR